jgi:ssRNA-specific RNase YbeY (16S rRNA maturation enzyme)
MAPTSTPSKRKKPFTDSKIRKPPKNLYKGVRNRVTQTSDNQGIQTYISNTNMSPTSSMQQVGKSNIQNQDMQPGSSTVFMQHGSNIPPTSYMQQVGNPNKDMPPESSNVFMQQVGNPNQDLQNQIEKIMGRTLQIQQNLKQDLNLVYNEITDHHIIHKKFFIQEEEFNIISLNIAQLAQERSMIIFGKYLADLLRSKKNLLKNKNFKENIKNMSFEETVADIVKEYLPGDLSPTNSKITIKKSDPSHNSRYQNLFTEIENLYNKATGRKMELQRIEFRCGETKKSPSKIKNLYKYDNVTTHVKYCDFYFEDGELSPEQYAKRLEKALTSLRKRTEKMQNVFICLQEINPYNTFVDTFVNFNNDNYFTLILPTFIEGATNLLLLCNNNYVEKNQSKTDELMVNIRTQNQNQFKTINDITPIENKEDKKKEDNMKEEGNMKKEDKKIKDDNIIKVFRGVKKKRTQNLLYEIITKTGATLHLYNIHGEWIENQSIMKIFQDIIIPKIEENKNKNIITIIVGDFNFFLTHDYLHRLQLLLRSKDIHSEFTYTPEVLYDELDSCKDINNDCSEPNSLDGFIYAAPSVQVNLLPYENSMSP